MKITLINLEVEGDVEVLEDDRTKRDTSTRRPANVNRARKRKHAALRLPKMSLLKVETTVMSYIRQSLAWSC